MEESINNTLDDVPFDMPSSGYLEPRKPKISRNRRSNSLHAVRSVSFNNNPVAQQDQNKPSLIGKLIGAKDAVLNFVMGKSVAANPTSDTRTSIPPPQLRKASLNSDYRDEFQMALDGEDLKNGQADNHMLAIMKENSRLRSQVLSMRNSMSQRPIPGSRSVSLSEKDKIKNQNLQIWIERQSRIAPSDHESATSSDVSSEKPNLRQDRQLEKATSIAAAVAAGVTAAHQMNATRKKSSKSQFDQTAALISALDSQNARLNLSTGKKYNRKETVTVPLNNFGKPNLTQMKQENDRLAKALGLI